MNGYPIKKIIDHATSEKHSHNAECCGFVISGEYGYDYYKCENTARNKQQDFRIDKSEYAKASKLGEIVCVVHSHPNKGANPSEYDKYSHASGNIAWLIVGLAHSEQLNFMPAPEKVAKLTGRPFIHGVSDCWSTCRDFYRQNGLILPDYERKNEWWKNGGNLYEELFTETGFIPVEDGEFLYGDFLLMNIGSRVCNHAAIYVGNNRIIHHLSGRLSEKAIYGDFYRKRTRFHLRHKDFYGITESCNRNEI